MCPIIPGERLKKEKIPVFVCQDNDTVMIREMLRNDVAQILSIEIRSFVAPWTRGLFEETLSSPIYLNLVMETEGAVVGYIILYTVADEGHVMSVAVHPDHRQKGHGARLLSHALRYCAQNSVSVCFLEVRESNEAAQALYRRFGFNVIGKRKRYYPETNEDALVMRLLLNGE